MVITQKITSVAFEIHDGETGAFMCLVKIFRINTHCSDAGYGIQMIVQYAAKGPEKLIKEMEGTEMQ